jgi:hypothetical protein
VVAVTEGSKYQEVWVITIHSDSSVVKYPWCVGSVHTNHEDARAEVDRLNEANPYTAASCVSRQILRQPEAATFKDQYKPMMRRAGKTRATFRALLIHCGFTDDVINDVMEETFDT